MSYVSDPIRCVARKEHRCTWCGEAILSGEQYFTWRSVDDGRWCQSKMHSECYSVMGEELYPDEGYIPYSNDRPEG